MGILNVHAVHYPLKKLLSVFQRVLSSLILLVCSLVPIDEDENNGGDEEDDDEWDD